MEMPLTPSSNDRLRNSANASNELIKKEEVPISEVIRSEVNLLTFPFFALWDKDVRRRTETEYKSVIKRGSQKLEIAWIVVSSPRYGYPGPFDREVYKAIEQIINEFPVPIQNPIPIGSLYNLCRRLGINKHGGSQYRKIKESLKRITTTSIESRGTYYSKVKEEWVEDIFHIYERVIFKGTKLPNGSIADTNYLFLNNWYLENINAHYVKPVDWKYCKSLGIPIAQRLYELLSVKFYGSLKQGGKFLSYKYSTLCDLLPITRQKYASKARQVLEPAHNKLKETSFLEGWAWEELPQKEKDWLIRYYPGKRAVEEIGRFKVEEQLEFELPSRRHEEAIGSEAELSIEESSIAKQLILRGITQSTVRKLVKVYTINQIQEQITVFDWLVENMSPLVQKNPAGFLRKSIEENYEPPKEYANVQTKRAKEQEESDRKERWMKHREELIRQNIADWDTIPPTERAAGRLDFWIAGEKLNSRWPTEEQIEAMRQELIDNLPKTYEEKWEHISRNYPEEPPEDFE